jgi:hypothetical protein
MPPLGRDLRLSGATLAGPQQGNAEHRADAIRHIARPQPNREEKSATRPMPYRAAKSRAGIVTDRRGRAGLLGIGDDNTQQPRSAEICLLKICPYANGNAHVAVVAETEDAWGLEPQNTTVLYGFKSRSPQSSWGPSMARHSPGPVRESTEKPTPGYGFSRLADLDSCPPPSAIPVDGTFYAFHDCETPSPETDFTTAAQRDDYPGANECERRSNSIWSNLEALKRRIQPLKARFSLEALLYLFGTDKERTRRS